MTKISKLLLAFVGVGLATLTTTTETFADSNGSRFGITKGHCRYDIGTDPCDLKDLGNGYMQVVRYGTFIPPTKVLDPIIIDPIDPIFTNPRNPIFIDPNQPISPWPGSKLDLENLFND